MYSPRPSDQAFGQITLPTQSWGRKWAQHTRQRNSEGFAFTSEAQSLGRGHVVVVGCLAGRLVNNHTYIIPFCHFDCFNHHTIFSCCSLHDILFCWICIWPAACPIGPSFDDATAQPHNDVFVVVWARSISQGTGSERASVQAQRRPTIAGLRKPINTLPASSRPARNPLYSGLHAVLLLWTPSIAYCISTSLVRRPARLYSAYLLLLDTPTYACITLDSLVIELKKASHVAKSRIDTNYHIVLELLETNRITSERITHAVIQLSPITTPPLLASRHRPDGRSRRQCALPSCHSRAPSREQHSFLHFFGNRFCH